MRRGGPWWTPTLKERPRLAKPPLTVWIAATFVSPETVARLDAQDPVERDAAYRDLAFEIRWPALLCSAVTLLAAFEFGQVLLGTNTALTGVMLFATTLLFTRFGRSATTDVQLMLWVAWTNVFLLHAFLRGKRWMLVAAGTTLGLAFMSKGPVAFAQSLLPALAAFGWVRSEVPRLPLRSWVLPALVGAVLFSAIALPWYAAQLFKDGHFDPHVWTRWKQEVTREGATNLERDPFYNYISIVWMMAPWFVFFLCGLVAVFAETKKPWGRRLFAAGFFVGIPIVIMSCVKDKPERYLLPLGPAAALLAGHSLVTMYRAGAPFRDRVVRVLGLSLAWLAAVAAMVAAVVVMQRLSLPVPKALLLVAGAITVMLGAFAWACRSCNWAAIATSAGAMFVAGTVGLFVYTHTPMGQTGYKAVADLIRTDYPGRPVFALQKEHDPLAHDVNIYLNRVVQEVPVAEVTAADAVLLVVQREKSGEPVAPTGWKKEHTLSAEKRVLAICVRE